MTATKVKTETEEVKAEVAEVKAELSFEDALTKAPRAKANGDRLGLYVVLLGADAVVVRAALKKAGVDGNLAGYLRGLVLADLKKRLAKV